MDKNDSHAGCLHIRDTPVLVILWDIFMSLYVLRPRYIWITATLLLLESLKHDRTDMKAAVI